MTAFHEPAPDLLHGGLEPAVGGGDAAGADQRDAERERLGRTEARKALTGGDNPGDMVLLAYGGFLERRGRRADAIAAPVRGPSNWPCRSP